MDTLRTVLTQPTVDDYDNIFNLHNNTEVNRYLGGSVTKEAFDSFFTLIRDPKIAHLYFVVRHRDHNTFMGYVYIDPYKHKDRYHLSYEFLPEYWNQGYGTEVLQRVFEYVFKELELDALYAEIHRENKASIALATKLGMSLDATCEPSEPEEVMYSVRKDEYVSGV